MIQQESLIKIADNSGAIKAQCIRVLKNKTIAKIGNEIVVTIKKAKPLNNVKKGEIQKAILIRTRKETLRLNGTNIRFKTNDSILINEEKQPIGNRVFGPVLAEMRNTKCLKILTLATIIL